MIFILNKRNFCEFSKKKDYEQSQIFNPNEPIVTQPFATITQPMSNIENPVVQTQALLVSSSMLNSTQGQINTETTPLPNIIHSNQTSESIMTHSKEGQMSARTMNSPSPKPEGKLKPASIIQPPEIEHLQPDYNEA